MDFSLFAEDVGETRWALETIGYGMRGVALVSIVLPFLVEGRPLSWLTDRLTQMANEPPLG
jgi:hypothetical protein